MNDKMLKPILEDLEFLETIPRGQESEADLRRNAAILRRLLVEGILGQAWSFLGFEKGPFLEGPDLAKTLASYDMDQINYAVVSGPLDGGVVIMSSTEPFRGFEDEKMLVEYSAMHLSKYCESQVCYFNKVWINRREIIKYIANILGGVHLSDGPGAKEYARKVSALENCFRAYQKDIIFFELSSIQQSLVNSGDITMLKAKIRERLSI